MYTVLLFTPLGLYNSFSAEDLRQIARMLYPSISGRQDTASKSAITMQMDMTGIVWLDIHCTGLGEKYITIHVQQARPNESVRSHCNIPGRTWHYLSEHSAFAADVSFEDHTSNSLRYHCMLKRW